MGNYCYGPQAKEKLQVTVSGFCAKSHSNSFCAEVIKSLQKLKQRKVHGIVFQEQTNWNGVLTREVRFDVITYGFLLS